MQFNSLSSRASLVFLAAFIYIPVEATGDWLAAEVAVWLGVVVFTLYTVHQTLFNVLDSTVLVLLQKMKLYMIKGYNMKTVEFTYEKLVW